jgi:hypothetical protein
MAVTRRIPIKDVWKKPDRRYESRNLTSLTVLDNHFRQQNGGNMFRKVAETNKAQAAKALKRVLHQAPGFRIA